MKLTNEELNKIRVNVENDDEYSSMSWGSADAISGLLDHIDELESEIKLKTVEMKTVAGLTIEEIEYMKYYFKKHLIEINPK